MMSVLHFGLPSVRFGPEFVLVLSPQSVLVTSSFWSPVPFVPQSVPLFGPQNVEIFVPQSVLVLRNFGPRSVLVLRNFLPQSALSLVILVRIGKMVLSSPSPDMRFNTSKCEILQVGTGTRTLTDTHFYTLLGLLATHNLSWSDRAHSLNFGQYKRQAWLGKT